MTCSCKYKHDSKILTQRTYYVFALAKGHTYVTKSKKQFCLYNGFVRPLSHAKAHKEKEIDPKTNNSETL